jgi:hypothetical protein
MSPFFIAAMACYLKGYAASYLQYWLCMQLNIIS